MAVVVKDKAEGELLYISHFATCPAAKRHRGWKGKKPAVGRVCPFAGCGKPIPRSMFSCRPHWYSLHFAKRAVINRAYSDYLADRIGLEELRVIQQGVLGEVQ